MISQVISSIYLTILPTYVRHGGNSYLGRYMKQLNDLFSVLQESFTEASSEVHLREQTNWKQNLLLQNINLQLP